MMMLICAVRCARSLHNSTLHNRYLQFDMVYAIRTTDAPDTLELNFLYFACHGFSSFIFATFSHFPVLRKLYLYFNI